ncbi:MAG: dihydropteroate synthase [Armatimonadota bacterium]|nr:dihydropteroate synthase [Armatimonadota bacterium]MDR7519510.1 dihydropteroate synthase [Armatimonadota bacterium]MDR7550199.1 dihydropteroate synthase [Armatimonadota bacterium]
MFIIGERINGMFRSVARAIRDRDANAIADLARRQVAAGAHALDLNTGPTADDPAEVMTWLVQTVQEATDVPLSIDSARPPVIAAGLRACRRPAIINSTTGAKAKLDALLPLAREYGAGLIALTNDERGIPRNAAARAEIALTIVARAMEAGLPTDRLYLDPIVLPVNAAQDQCKEALEAVAMFRTLCEPAPHILLGLSNVSQGTTNRSLINRTYLVMAMALGCDAAILDPLDRDLIDAIRTARILLNQEIYAESYLQSQPA